MINLGGFLIVICSFFVPFWSRGKVPSTFFFWLGFFLLLWPTKRFPNASTWLKWARIGLLINVIGNLFTFFLGYFLINTSFADSSLADLFFLGISWILNPIGGILDLLFPSNQVTMPDRSVHSAVSFLRATLTSFFDILVYIGIGFAIGEFSSRKKSKEKD